MRKGAILVGAAVAVACATPAPRAPRAQGPSPQVMADIDRAEKAELARQHDVAHAAYERAVADAHDPASIAFARREFAETLETWGELAEAIAQLEAAVAALPSDVGSWHDLGILYSMQGDDARAITALQRAKQLAPGSLKVRIALASAYQCRNDRAAAIAEYRELLALDLPDRLRAAIRYWLGVLDRSPGPLGCKRPGGPAPPPGT